MEVHTGEDLKEEEGRQIMQAWLVVQLDKDRRQEYTLDPPVKAFAEQVLAAASPRLSSWICAVTTLHPWTGPSSSNAPASGGA